MSTREIGKQQEDRLCSYLEKKGYRIEDRNFCCRFGEIDIIARQGNYLVFAEVKYRRSTRLGTPDGAVNRQKRGRIIRTADYYRMKKRIMEDVPCRFDVLAVTDEAITHYENAFDYYGNTNL